MQRRHRDAMAEADGQRRRLFPIRRRRHDRHRTFRQLDAGATGHADLFHPGPLHRGAGGFRHPGRADVGRVGKNFRHRQPTMLALEIVDGETADLDRVGRVKPVPDMHDAAVQRQGCGLQLESRTRLIRPADSPVITRIRRCRAGIVDVEIRQRHHGDHLAGAHVHHNPAGADRLELGHGSQQFLAHHRLRAHINGQPQRRTVRRQSLIEMPLHPGDAVLIHVHAAEHLGRHPPQRITPALSTFEINPGNAQRIDRNLGPRRHLAGDIDKLLGLIAQPLGHLGLIDVAQHRLQLVRGFLRIHQRTRIGDHRRRRQRQRQHLAIAINDHRPLAARQALRLCCRRCNARRRSGRNRRSGVDPVGVLDLRHPRRQHGSHGQLNTDGGEHPRRRNRRHHQPPAGLLHRRPSRQVGRGDPHVLHAWHGGVARCAEPLGWRVGVRRRGVAGLLAHCPAEFSEIG